MNNSTLIIFFGILISMISCKEIDPNKQIDEGEFGNNIYTSKEIGWTIHIPKNWKIVSREQNENFQKKGVDVMENVMEAEIDVSGVKNLIGFHKNNSNIFQSTSEPFLVEYPGEWEENNANLKVLIYQTYESQGIKVDTTITKIIKINGLDFHTYQFTLYNPKGDVVLNQLMYSRLINGLDFGVNINYNNESDKKEMLDAWLHSKFRKN